MEAYIESGQTSAICAALSYWEVSFETERESLSYDGTVDTAQIPQGYLPFPQNHHREVP